MQRPGRTAARENQSIRTLIMQSGKKKRGLSKTSLHSGPNMTPMVDIVMCILIFFMLGTTFASPDLYLTNDTPAVKTGGLNKATGVAKMPATRIDIKLARRGSHTMATIANFQTEDLSGQLANWLKEKERKLRSFKGVKEAVLIMPTNAVPYQDVITTYQDCTQARFKAVGFAYAH